MGSKDIRLRTTTTPEPEGLPQPPTKEKLRQAARKQFVEGVSISGLVELYTAPSLLIRIMWIMALLAAVVSIVYHAALLVISYKNQNWQYDFLHADLLTIPFPKVSICAPSGVNKTWASEHLRLPPREQKLFEQFNETDKRKFIENVSALMGNSLEFIVDNSISPTKTPLYFAYQHVLTETTRHLPQGTWVAALASCEQLVSNCQLVGVDYNCCENSSLRISDDGPCYDLGVDIFDRAQNQPRPSMSTASLTFDLSMDWNYILPSSRIDGFSVHIGDPVTMLGQPVAIPGGMHAMIDVSQPVLRLDKSECFDKKMPDTTFGPYDARGYNCAGARFCAEVVELFMGCTFRWAAYVPNASDECTGAHTLPIKMFATHGFVGQDKMKVEDTLHKLQLDINHSKTKCLPLCKRWEFSPRPSYSQLLRSDYSTADGSLSTDNVTRSRVTVYLGSPYYMSRTENELDPFYKTFLLIADVMALHVGVSVISLAEVVFYGLSLTFVYWISRVGKIKIGPSAS